MPKKLMVSILEISMKKMIKKLDMTDGFSVLDDFLFTFVYAMNKFLAAIFDLLETERWQF